MDTFVVEPDSRAQVMQLEENVKDFGLTYFGLSDKRQGLNKCSLVCVNAKCRYFPGIVHVIGPEQGFTVSLHIHQT